MTLKVDNFVERRCRECGEGTLRLVAKPGREWPYKGMSFTVPADFEIPTCDRCGEESLDPDRAEALDAVLERIYAEHLRGRFGEAVEALVAHGCSQRFLETLLGQSQGYFSHILRGGNAPSPLLVREVVLLAKEPEKRIKEAEQALAADPPPWLIAS